MWHVKKFFEKVGINRNHEENKNHFSQLFYLSLKLKNYIVDLLQKT